MSILALGRHMGILEEIFRYTGRERSKEFTQALNDIFKLRNDVRSFSKSKREDIVSFITAKEDASEIIRIIAM
jgi:hypothetical protein